MGDSAIVEGARARAFTLTGERLSEIPALALEGLERGDTSACERLAALLSEVAATLVMLDRPAIAVVATDAARVVEAVAAGTLVERPANGPEDLLRSVLGAHEALSDVVAEAAGAQRSVDVPDTALPALGVLNALRALLGVPFLSEALLLALDIRIDEQEPAPDASVLAPAVRAARPRLMRQLIEWFKAVNDADEGGAATATAELADLVSALADQARDAGLSLTDQDTLGAAACIAEAISTRRLPDDGAVRRLFGQFERWLVDRWVAPAASSAQAVRSPHALLRNLLYYVSTATAPYQHPVWDDLVERYSLDRVAHLARFGFVDAEPQAESAARSAHRPLGRRLRGDVVSRVRDDLQPLLDWLAQGGRHTDEPLAVQRGERLRELLPVFELLGASRCREQLGAAIALLDPHVNATLDEPARFAVARQFVLFEQALTDFARGPTGSSGSIRALPDQGAALSARMASVSGRSSPTDGYPSGPRDATDALVREARRRLSDCESDLESATAGGEMALPMEPLAARLRGMARALDILPRPEASALIDRLAEIVGWLPSRPTPPTRQALAEYVVSIDACLASDGRYVPGDGADPLDGAEQALEALELHLPAARALGAAMTASPFPPPGTGERTAGESKANERYADDPASKADGSAPTERALDAFMKIGAALAEDAPDVEAVANGFSDIRLAARDAGHEQLERLASAAGRRLSQSPTPLSGATASAILDAHLALPQLIEGMHDPAAAPVLDDLDDTLRALDADLAAERAGLAAPDAETDAGSCVDLDEEVDDPMDATLRDVFVAECAEHVGTLERELVLATQGPVRAPPSDRLLRALHTLSGSARTAEATQVDRLARPLHRAGLSLQSRADALDDDIIVLFGEAVSGVEQARQDYAEGLEVAAPDDGLVRRLAAIEAGPAQAAAAVSVLAPAPPRSPQRQSLDEIFAEEARELLDRLAALADGPGPAEHRTERALATLHTLKGSARVAGQPRLADRAHLAESDVAGAQSDSVCVERLRIARRELDALLVSPADPAPAHDVAQVGAVRPDDGSVRAGGDDPGNSPVALVSAVPESAFPGSATADSAGGADADADVDSFDGRPDEATDGSDGAADDAPQLTRVRERDWERLMTLAQDIAGSQARLSSELARLQEASRELELAAQRWRRLPAAATVLETEAARELLSDLGSVRVTLRDSLRAVDTEQRRGARAGIALQQDLVRARLVRFDACRARVERTLEDAAAAAGREAQLLIEGGATTLDATLHGRLLPALEHLVRNAVVHGIESPETRERDGKDRCGRVRLGVSIEGVDIVVTVDDDGRGIDVPRVAARLGLEESVLESRAALLDALAGSGFSTVDEATGIGGRGLGVGAVSERLGELGGRLTLTSTGDSRGGARFELRLPQRIPVQQVVLVQAGELVAIPVNAVASIDQIAADGEEAVRLSRLLGHDDGPSDPDERSAWRRLRLSIPGGLEGVEVNAVIGYREIVVQSLDVQLASLKRYTGVAALPDGRRVFVIDPATLDRQPAKPLRAAPEPLRHAPPLALIADDSPTQRAWSTETFESLGYRVLVTRDGREALDALERNQPDVMLLDVDMPRVDGFGVLEAVQKSGGARFPILMLTSRHSARDRSAALAFGAADFLAKPGSREMLHDALLRAGAPMPVPRIAQGS